MHPSNSEEYESDAQSGSDSAAPAQDNQKVEFKGFQSRLSIDKSSKEICVSNRVRTYRFLAGDVIRVEGVSGNSIFDKIVSFTLKDGKEIEAQATEVSGIQSGEDDKFKSILNEIYETVESLQAPGETLTEIKGRELREQAHAARQSPSNEVGSLQGLLAEPHTKWWILSAYLNVWWVLSAIFVAALTQNILIAAILLTVGVVGFAGWSIFFYRAHQKLYRLTDAAAEQLGLQLSESLRTHLAFDSGDDKKVYADSYQSDAQWSALPIYDDRSEEMMAKTQDRNIITVTQKHRASNALPQHYLVIAEYGEDLLLWDSRSDSYAWLDAATGVTKKTNVFWDI